MSGANRISSGKNLPRNTRRVERYGSATELLKRFNPQAQLKAAEYELRMFETGRFPRLSDVDAVHGREITIDWLIIQIDDALNSSGVTMMRARTEQITDVANTIYMKYHYLMLTELLLFFFKFKNGDFGDFKGVFNQQSFMKTFVEFKKYRAIMQRKFEQTQREKTQSGGDKTMSWEEYVASKNNIANL